MDMRNKGWLRLALWTGVLWMLCAAALAEGVSWTGREWDGSTEGEAPLRNCDIVSIGREAAPGGQHPLRYLRACGGGRDGLQQGAFALLPPAQPDFLELPLV